MADVVLDSVEVVSLLPKQNADAVLQNVVVALCRVNAREGRISLDDDIHVLAGPGEQLCVSVRLGGGQHQPIFAPGSGRFAAWRRRRAPAPGPGEIRLCEGAWRYWPGCEDASETDPAARGRECPGRPT